jgi:hypothetical protein
MKPSRQKFRALVTESRLGRRLASPTLAGPLADWHRAMIHWFPRAALVTSLILVVTMGAVITGCASVRRSIGVGQTPTDRRLPPNPQQLSRWDQLPVHYCIDDSADGFLPNDQFAGLVDRAFSTWRVPFNDDGACAAPRKDGNHVNEIGWGIPPNQPRTPGRIFEAGVTFEHVGECTIACDRNDRVYLTEADIIIDKNAPRQFRNTRCVFSTLLHETGHFLGLEHLPSPAVMAAETSSCPQTLADADRAALLARYGAVVTG